MAFMTDDNMANYQNQAENSTKKKPRYNTMPRYSVRVLQTSNLSLYIPLLTSCYYFFFAEISHRPITIEKICQLILEYRKVNLRC